jgi:sugar phosphate isomerase/epimerase
MTIQESISRRGFTKMAVYGTALLAAGTRPSAAAEKSGAIRLGGPVFEKYDSPEQWIAALKKLGYSAAYCPVDSKQSDDVVNAYAKAAKDAGIVISETGAWSNPIGPDEAKRKEAQELCKTQLALADRIGANCCVNISGSVGEVWDGHDPKNLTQETFDKIVEVTRSIIDAVKPTRTFFTLETMPWAFPDSPDTYLDLIKAIDRKQFAAHLDPTNLINCPRRYYSTGKIIQECFEKFGRHIKSCHAKDIILSQKQTVHLDEIRVGLGNLDYAVFLKELSKLDGIPLMMEHLSKAEDYDQAAAHIRAVGKENGLSFM